MRLQLVALPLSLTQHNSTVAKLHLGLDDVLRVDTTLGARAECGHTTNTPLVQQYPVELLAVVVGLGPEILTRASDLEEDSEV